MRGRQLTFTNWLVFVVIALVIARAGWLFFAQGGLKFNSDILDLLPVDPSSGLVEQVISHINLENNRIVLMIDGGNKSVVDNATDVLVERLEIYHTKQSVVKTIIDAPPQGLLLDRVKAMLPYRNRLLADQSKTRINSNPEQQITHRLNKLIEFPPQNITNPERDEFGLLDDFISERFALSNSVTSGGLYLQPLNQPSANIVFIQLDSGEIASDLIAEFVIEIDRYIADIKSQFAVEVVTAGMPIHAVSMRTITAKEITWMSLVALVLTVALFVLLTRSIIALTISIVCLLLALLGGLVLSQWLLGLPHIISLIMASTAIGICIDFSFHYWIHYRQGLSGKQIISQIKPGMTMSMLTTVAAFIVIALIAIPVLQQTAVVISGAILISWLCVMWLYPVVAKKTSRVSTYNLAEIPIKWCNPILLTILAIAIIGIAQISTDDDPGKLGRSSGMRQTGEARIQAALNIKGPISTFLITASDSQTMIEREEGLLTKLTASELAQFVSISRLVPSLKKQTENYLIATLLQDTVNSYAYRSLDQILTVPLVTKDADTNLEYDLPWVIKQPWAQQESHHILSCNTDGCATYFQARGLVGAKINAQCGLHNWCRTINIRQQYKRTLQHLRTNLTYSMIWVMVVITIILVIRYRRQAIDMIVVPILSVVAALAVLGLIGQPITVFTLAALFPLTGLSIDYVVFSQESTHHRQTTRVAIAVSALTTTLSFSILCFSQIPVVRFFALPVAVGIPIAWLLVEILQQRRIKNMA